MTNIKALNPIQDLMRRITTLGKNEAVTKQLLGELSREVLSIHLPVTNTDIGGINCYGFTIHNVNVVNKLLSVLSPVNKRVARIFFINFLPYTFDSETNTFGKMLKKDSARDTKHLAIASFLHEADNNIWTYQEEHINMEAKPVDYSAKISKTIASALKADKGGMSASEVLQAVFAGGVSVADVIAMLEVVDNQAKAA